MREIRRKRKEGRKREKERKKDKSDLLFGSDTRGACLCSGVVCASFDDFAVSVFHCVRCLNLASNSDDRRLCVCAVQMTLGPDSRIHSQEHLRLHGILPLFSPQKPASLSLTLSLACNRRRKERRCQGTHTLTYSLAVSHSFAAEAAAAAAVEGARRVKRARASAQK